MSVFDWSEIPITETVAYYDPEPISKLVFAGAGAIDGVWSMSLTFGTNGSIKGASRAAATKYCSCKTAK